MFYILVYVFIYWSMLYVLNISIYIIINISIYMYILFIIINFIIYSELGLKDPIPNLNPNP